MIKNIFIAAILFATVFSSCQKNFLDRTPLDQISDATFWKNESQLTLALNGLYAYLKNDETVTLDQLGDNSINYNSGDDYRLVSSGNYGSDIGLVNNQWVNAYQGIRRCNVFLANYQNATDVSETVKNQMAGEAKTIRAYLYMYLTLFFGDVPLVTNPLDIDDEQVYGPRTSKDSVVNFVLNEFDEAAPMMQAAQMTGSNLGRFSKGAPLAFRARMALYAGKWAEAEKSARAVMDLGIYNLYSTGNPNSDYNDLFTYKGKLSNGANNETIAARLNLTDVSMHNLSRLAQVPDGVSRFNATKSLVDAYLCSDGLPIDKSPLYKEDSYENIFQNRDPRLKQTILVPGAAWGGKKDGNPANTNTSIYTAPKFLTNNTGCSTVSGFYYTKYVELSTVSQVSRDQNDIHLIRLAEVYLTYAEAKMEEGTLTQEDVDITINKLRDRVGMTHMILSGLAQNGLDVHNEFHRERRVELAGEGQRWFDLMRWKQGTVLGEDTKGVRRDLVMDQSQVSNVAVDGNGYIIVANGRRFVDPKNYLFPVPLNQTQRNAALGQNPGW